MNYINHLYHVFSGEHINFVKSVIRKLEEERRQGRLPGPVRRKGIASNEMCTFLIINISSLQLIPVNVIAYRSQYGSVVGNIRHPSIKSGKYDPNQDHARPKVI